MKRTLPFALLALGLGACDPPETLPSIPSEAGPVPMDMNVDSAPPGDMGPQPDADPRADAAPPVNEGPCGLPETLPPMGAMAVIGGGEISYLVWFQPRAEGGDDGALIAQRVELRRRLDAPAPQEDGGVAPDAGEATVIAELGTARAVRCLTDFSGELMGARLPGVAAEQSAWALVSEGDEPWTAVDVTGRTEALDLGLYGPVRMAQRFGLGTDPDTVLIVGRTGAEPTAPVGLRALGGFGSQSPSFLRRGVPLPVSVAPSGADWVFAFADGTCLLLDDDAGAPSREFGEETLAGLGTWTCRSRAGDHFVGSGALGSTVDALYLARPEETGGVTLRHVRPGLDYDQRVTEYAPDDAGGEEGMEVAPAESDAGPMGDGGVDGDAGIEPPTATAVRPTLINPIPEGVALRMGSDAHPIVAVAHEGGLHVLSPASTPVGILSGPRDTVFTVHLDADTPTVMPAVWAETQPTEPADQDALCPNRSPERCDDVDHDCDGDALGGTCCRGEDDLDWLYRLKAGQTPARDNHLTYALNDREQQVITLAQETRLLDRGGAMTSVCAVCWPGEMRVRMAAGQGRTVALAVALDGLESETCPDDAVVPCRAEAATFVPGPTDVAPYHALAVYERRTLDQEQPARFLPSPCQGEETIQGLEVHEDRRSRFIPEVEMDDPEAPTVYFMRVFCETMWFDLPFDGTEPIAQLYSDIEGADGAVDIEWLGPARHGDDGAVFLARGIRADGAVQIDLWRSRNPTDAEPVSLSIVQKPEWLTTMSDGDTALRFHLPTEGGVPARVVSTPHAAAPAPTPMDGEMAAPAPAETTHVERYVPALGWTRAPTTRWPIESEITPDGKMAVSAAHLVEPTADNLADQRVGIFIHDLRAGAGGWGRQVDPSGVIKFNGYHGISFFARSGDPTYAILGTGEVGANGRVSYTPLEIGCTPPR